MPMILLWAQINAQPSFNKREENKGYKKFPPVPV